jgi:hypothetical protein
MTTKVAVVRRVRHSPPVADATILLDSDEIEVACDLLWFVGREAGLDAFAEALWSRLQEIRLGDLGESASIGVSDDEARAVVSAARSVDRRVPLDPSEAALVDRLVRQGGATPS